MSTTRGVEFVLNIRGNAKEKADAISASAIRAEKSLKGMERSSEGVSKSLTGIREAAEKMQLGGLNRSIGVLQSGLAGLANPATGAALAIGAVATASVAATAGVVKLVHASSAWLAELDEAGRSHGLVTPQQREDIMSATAAMGELGIELKRIGVIIAADFAPYVARATEALAGLLREAEGMAKAADWAGIFLGTLTGPQVQTAIDLWNTLAASIGRATGASRGASGGGVPVPGGTTSGSQGFGIAEALGQQLSMRELAKYLPKSSGGKGGNDSERVKVDLGDEWEAAEREDALDRQAMKDQGREMIAAALKAEQDRAKMLESLAKTAQELKEQGDVPAALKSGMLAMAKNLIDATVNLGATLRGGFDYVLGSVEGLGRTFENLFTQVVPRLIERLPRLIGAVLNLPFAIMRGIINAVPALALALANAIMRPIQAIIDFFRGGKDEKFYTGRKEKILGTSFERGRFSLFGFFNDDDQRGRGGKLRGGDEDDREGRRGERTRNLFTGLFGGDDEEDRKDRRRNRSRMTGGYIERTGRYMLHAGERVVPPTGATTSATLAAMRGGGGMQSPVSVSIGTAVGMDARELARWISREIGSYGTGASLAARV